MTPDLFMKLIAGRSFYVPIQQRDTTTNVLINDQESRRGKNYSVQFLDD